MITKKWAILLSTLLLTGCWSRVEINDRAFVEAMFVDKGENGLLEVTLSFPLPNRLVPGQVGGSGSTGKPYTLVTSTGRTITEAYRNMQVQLPRRINWGHTKVIVFSEEMARSGVSPVFEFLARQPNLNINNSIFIAPGKAKEIGDMVAAFERFPSTILKEFAAQEVIINTTTKDFLETENGDMVAGFLTKGKKPMVSENGKTELWVGTDGAALFRNYKMVGKLSTKETRGTLWLRNLVESSVVTIKSPTDQKVISLLILQGHTKIRPSKRDPFTFDIFVKAEDDISESYSNIDLTNERNIYTMERIAEKQIETRIRQAFKVSKKVKADVFQFGEYLSWYKPKMWKKVKKDWPSIYQNKVKINIRIDLKIKRPGGEKNPVRIKEIQS